MSASPHDEGKDRGSGSPATSGSEIEMDVTKHPRYQEILKQIEDEFANGPLWSCAGCGAEVASEMDECVVCMTPKPPATWVAERRIKELQAKEILEDAEIQSALASIDANTNGSPGPANVQGVQSNISELHKLLGISASKKPMEKLSYKDALGSLSPKENYKEMLKDDINFDEEKERPKRRLDFDIVASSSFILPQFVEGDQTFQVGLVLKNNCSPVWPTHPDGTSAVSAFMCGGLSCLVKSFPVQYLTERQSSKVTQLYNLQQKEYHKARKDNVEYQFRDIQIPEDDAHIPKHFPLPGEYVHAQFQISVPSLKSLAQFVPADKLWEYANLQNDMNQRRLEMRMASQSDGKGQGVENEILPFCVTMPSFIRLGYPRGAIVPDANTPHFAREHRFVGVTFDPTTKEPMSVDQNAIIHFGPWIGISFTFFEGGYVFAASHAEHNTMAPYPEPPQVLKSEFNLLDQAYRSLKKWMPDVTYSQATVHHEADYSGIGSEHFAGADAGPPPIYEDSGDFEDAQYWPNDMDSNDFLNLSGDQVGYHNLDTSEALNTSNGSKKPFLSVRTSHNEYVEDSMCDVGFQDESSSEEDGGEIYENHHANQSRSRRGGIDMPLSGTQIQESLLKHDAMPDFAEDEDIDYLPVDEDDLDVSYDTQGNDLGDGQTVWACVVCTLENPMSARVCNACESPRRY